MPTKGLNRVFLTTSTTGSGTPFVCSSTPAATGYRTLAQEATDGASYYYARWDGTSGAYEEGYGVLALATRTITPTAIIRSSNGAGVPVNWSGTQNVIFSPGQGALVYAHNNGSDFASASTVRTNLGLGTAAVLDVGTTASKVVQLTAAAKLPAVDGSLLINLPAGTPSVPSGSVMPFYQSATPSGWTRHATLDDHVIRIVKSGSLVGVAGSVNGGTWAITGLSVGATTLTTAQMPAHSHTVASGAGGNILARITAGGLYTTPAAGSTVVPATDTDSTGGGGSHTHTLTSSGAWQPPCADCLLGTKN